MRILLVSPYFPPLAGIGAQRVWSFACAWRDAGHAVDVLTTAKFPDQDRCELPTEGIQVMEVSYPIPWLLRRLRQSRRQAPSAYAAPSSSWLQRLKQTTGIFSAVRMPDLSDAWVQPAVRHAQRTQRTWDVIVSSAGPYTAHMVAWKIAQHTPARWFGDYRDLWTDNHIYAGLPPFRWREQHLERACLAAMTGATTVSESLAERLRRRTTAPVQVIYNGFDAEQAARVSPARLLPSDGRVRLVYTGSIYTPFQDPAPLLEALRQVIARRPDFREKVRLTVAGQATGAFAELARQAQLSDLVEPLGMLPWDSALRLQRDADALIHLDLSGLPRGALTGKIFEYLHAACPMFVVGGSADSAVAALIHEARRGRHFGNNVDQLSQALETLCDNPLALRDTPNVPLIQALTRTEQARRFLDFIATTAPRRRGRAA